nr:hypothetical protein GCM10020093_061950 [Planobispora longispora]
MTATVDVSTSTPTTHEGLAAWVREIAELTQPDRIEWCDGSEAEWTRLTNLLVEQGTFTRLSKRQNSFYAASDPSDVARVEDRTYICSEKEEDAGPTNNWIAPPRCARPSARSSPGACAGGPCTSSRSAWARSAVRSPSSASRSPTRRTWPCRCGS